MRMGTVNNHGVRKSNDVPGAVAFEQKGSQNRVELSEADVRLFRALRKLNTPKQRVCSALWLSYEEYDELSERL